MSDFLAKTKAPRPGKCPVCDGAKYTYLNWAKRTEEEDSGRHYAASQLEFWRKLKIGQIYRCRLCGKWWYLHEQTQLMERVPADYQELLVAWDGGRFEPDVQMIAMLKKIGGLEADPYGNQKGIIRVPCCIVWANGQQSDPAVVGIMKHPMWGLEHRPLRLLESVLEVRESNFALSKEVRKGALQAEEVRMGFCPTRVQSSKGDVFILNGSADVFAYAGIKGSEIRLATSQFKERPEIVLSGTKVCEDWPITFVFCDWFLGCEELIFV